MKRKLSLFKSLLLTSIAFIPASFLISCSNSSSNSNPGSGSGSENKPQINYDFWTNQEAQQNKFSTLDSNNKLNIVQGRGADDIYDSTFTGTHVNAKPLQGRIINKQYQQLAKISFSVNFAFGNANYLGTAWILDYQIPDGVNQKDEGNSYNDSNYPTKWYFATNTHVMDDLKTRNSIYQETNTINWQGKSTTNVFLKRIKDPKLDYYYNQSSSGNYVDYDQYDISMTENGIDLDDPAVKPIFLGFDYLKSSPSDFINNVPTPSPESIPEDVKYNGTEEMAGFSVFEIDFTKIPLKNYPSEANNNPHLFAKILTNNYANWSYKDQFKPAKESLLNKKNEEFENKKFYSLGFPQEAALGGNHHRNTEHVALWIDQPETLSSSDYQNKGANLTLERHYNTFKNVPGIFDSIIGSADFGYKFQPLSKTVSSSGIIPYIYQGLLYTENNGDMQVGSSGSIFVDEDNYIYGIHFASDFTAHVGINFALKCEGYDYNGYYGNYNLQSYDLINGGYSNQKSSYREQLLKIYGKNFKTNIFRDTVSKLY